MHVPCLKLLIFSKNIYILVGIVSFSYKQARDDRNCIKMSDWSKDLWAKSQGYKKFYNSEEKKSDSRKDFWGKSQNSGMSSSKSDYSMTFPSSSENRESGWGTSSRSHDNDNTGRTYPSASSTDVSGSTWGNFPGSNNDKTDWGNFPSSNNNDKTDWGSSDRKANKRSEKRKAPPPPY